MNAPANLRFTVDHMWVRWQGVGLCVGITEFAQQALGDVVFADVPRVGMAVETGTAFSWLESGKAVVDLHPPVNGTIVGSNSLLSEKPELINRDPYGGGWICVIEPHAPADVDRLLDAEAYRVLVEQMAPGPKS
ncbi:MAG TPA: glycine cleavage system protein GcvH [Myxococcota bacterium]|nr:glycine cleavage system protein GcvH [Myxococcota bacterium]